MEKTIGGTSNDSGNAVITDISGNIFLGISISSSAYSLIVKLDQNGVIQSQKKYPNLGSMRK